MDAVDGPRLASLHLGAGTGFLAQVAGEVAQQPAELSASDLAGDPETLHDAVADRVCQPLLEPVEAVVETTSHLVVQTERVESLSQRFWPAGAEGGQRLRQRQARAYGGGEVVHRLRPDLRELVLAPPGPSTHHGDG